MNLMLKIALNFYVEVRKKFKLTTTKIKPKGILLIKKNA